MANRVRVSPRASRDVDEIWLYVAAENIRAANALIDRLTLASQMLAESPRSGRARLEFNEYLRSFPVGDHLIFYEPRPDGIFVVRILHGKRNITAEDLKT